jgi:hypothetical protein
VSRQLLLIALACLIGACQSVPPSKYSKSHERRDPCLIYFISLPGGGRAVEVEHHPEHLDPPASGFATGDFDASALVDVTANHQTTTMRIDIPSSQKTTPILDGKPLTVVALNSCMAYDPE